MNDFDNYFQSPMQKMKRIETKIPRNILDQATEINFNYDNIVLCFPKENPRSRMDVMEFVDDLKIRFSGKSEKRLISYSIERGGYTFIFLFKD